MVYTYYLVPLYLTTPNTIGMLTGNMNSTTTNKAITSYNISATGHTITYGPANACNKTASASGDASIDNANDTGPTLNITGMQPNPDAALDTTGGPVDCTVKVEDKKLTINYGDDKCIEITLTSANTIKKEATTVPYGHIFTGIDIGVAIIISLVAAIVWTWAYGICQDVATECDITNVDISKKKLTIKYKDANNAKVENAGYQDPPSGPPYKYTATDPKTKITYTFTLIDKIEMVLLIATIFPPVIVAILRRTSSFKHPQSPACEWSAEDGANFGQGSATDVDPMCQITDVKTSQNKLKIKYKGAQDEKVKVKEATYTEKQIGSTANYKYTVKDHKTKITYTFTLNEQLADGTTKEAAVLIPFYLVDKIEMVLLIATFFPPIIVATLQKVKPEYSPKTKFAGDGMGGWKSYSAFGTPYDASFYHAFDILIVIKISLAAIFIYSLHYRESHIVVLLRVKLLILLLRISIKSSVTITTGTVDGDCTDAPQEFKTAPTATLNLADATATITTKDGKATLEIGINITKIDANKAVLDALAHLASPFSPCKVEVTNNTLTITIKYKKDDKCNKTVITLTADALKTLGLKNSTVYNATVEVAPPPNHLTIKYKDGSVEKTAAVDITEYIDIEDICPEGMTPNGMTAITEEIAQKIKKDLKQTANYKTKYYHVKHPTTNIRYSFKLREDQATQLTTGKPITVPVIVQYGHIFTEGFSGTATASGNLDPNTITGITIKSITITDSTGKKTTYNKDPEGGAATEGTPSLAIKVGGGDTTATAYFKKAEAAAPGDPPGAPNSIILKYNDGGEKCITITGNASTATVHYGHEFSEILRELPVIVALLNRGIFGEGTKEYSPKTKYVWHGPNATNNGFGGWTRYLDTGDNHEEPSEPGECKDPSKHVPAHAWIWHFFNILVPIMIILAYGYYTNTQKTAITSYPPNPSIKTIKYGECPSPDKEATTSTTATITDPTDTEGPTLTITPTTIY
ncbi:Tpr-related protein family member, putative [Theileria annulata]|uniref:Tpr-related protein family member, putative n=1 Tax=Theileria annulata TaxID=5874 RepID=Q4UJ30_THEAN|nr:Tpr-related protein family member, putative [Theileria annulata]CAI72909.1 Tpr-related protein family member, putative [Theileria annulata]|eukprot:XP_953587.1 Tpr-related protein family member, putative [Theileria annulata]